MSISHVTIQKLHWNTQYYPCKCYSSPEFMHVFKRKWEARWLTDWMGSERSRQRDVPPKWLWNVHSYAAYTGVKYAQILDCTESALGRKLLGISILLTPSPIITCTLPQMLASPFLFLSTCFRFLAWIVFPLSFDRSSINCVIHGGPGSWKQRKTLLNLKKCMQNRHIHIGETSKYFWQLTSQSITLIHRAPSL